MTEILKWQDVYTIPFSGESLIYDAKHRFSMNGLADSGNIKRVLNKLNGETSKKLEKGEFYLNKDLKVIYKLESEEYPILWIRGWGRLTGSGGLNLDPELAGRLQEEFSNWVITTLNS